MNTIFRLEKPISSELIVIKAMNKRFYACEVLIHGENKSHTLHIPQIMSGVKAAWNLPGIKP
jgi:hypothetical protein